MTDADLQNLIRGLIYNKTSKNLLNVAVASGDMQKSNSIFASLGSTLNIDSNCTGTSYIVLIRNVDYGKEGLALFLPG